jgi:hypothetical protein
MFENLQDEIKNLIEEEGRDLKFKISDKIFPLEFKCTPSISYDFLVLDSGDEFSFLNQEINSSSSEEFPNLSDCQIYFQKIKEICNTNFRDLNDTCCFFKTINPNRKLKTIVDFIFSKKLQGDQIPTFIEIKLYTNTHGNKAPRVFGFIGNANIIYILFYDPFHKVFDRLGKI